MIFHRYAKLLEGNSSNVSEFGGKNDQHQLVASVGHSTKDLGSKLVHGATYNEGFHAAIGKDALRILSS